MKKLIIITILSLGFFSCESSKTKPVSQISFVIQSKISPPLLSEVTVSEKFQIDNSEDTILISKKGGYISIPKNCFMNSMGENVVKDVTISFHEYLNVGEILLSGIPMVYIESGDTMNFQSAGMCEVLAFNNKRQLKLKEGKQIGIGLRNLAQDNGYNLYYFDTLKGDWIEKKKNIPVILGNQLPLAPIDLQNIDTNDILDIEIEDYRIRPLYKMWHRSKFCVYGKNNLVSSDSSIWWYDMTINSTQNRDLYDLTFNGVDEKRKQWVYNLTVQPVIDSANYEQEVENFKQNMKTYVKKLEAFKRELSQNSANYRLVNKEIEANRKEDKILFAKQWQQDSLNMVNYLFDDSLRQIKQKVNDSLINVQARLKEQQQSERYKSNRTRIEVMRSFNISKMGIFNCDRFYTRPILVTKSIKMLVNMQARQFDSAYLVDVKSNVVLNYLKFSIDSYLIDLDLKDYVFVGILGGEIYMTDLSLDNLTERFNLVSMKNVPISEFKSILN